MAGVLARSVLGPRFFDVARPAEKLEVARLELSPVEGGATDGADRVVLVSARLDAVELELVRRAARRAAGAEEIP